MHGQRRWDIGSKRRLRLLRFRGNGPALFPTVFVLAALVVMWILHSWIHAGRHD